MTRAFCVAVLTGAPLERFRPPPLAARHPASCLALTDDPRLVRSAGSSPPRSSFRRDNPFRPRRPGYRRRARPRSPPDTRPGAGSRRGAHSPRRPRRARPSPRCGPQCRCQSPARRDRRPRTRSLSDTYPPRRARGRRAHRRVRCTSGRRRSPRSSCTARRSGPRRRRSRRHTRGHRSAPRLRTRPRLRRRWCRRPRGGRRACRPSSRLDKDPRLACLRPVGAPGRTPRRRCKPRSPHTRRSRSTARNSAPARRLGRRSRPRLPRRLREGHTPSLHLAAGPDTRARHSRRRGRERSKRRRRYCARRERSSRYVRLSIPGFTTRLKRGLRARRGVV